MTREEFKKMRETSSKPLTPIDIYNSPINVQLGAFQTMVREEYDKKVLHAVAQIGIDIDKEGLVEAINADRKRYNAAYAQGWEDCKKYYQERLDDIAALASKEVRPE